MRIFYGENNEKEIELEFQDMWDFLRKHLLHLSKEELIEEILQEDETVKSLVLWYKEDFIDYWREKYE
jgi:hypothetical protein